MGLESFISWSYLVYCAILFPNVLEYAAPHSHPVKMNVRNMNPSSLKIELDVTIVIEDDRSACAIRLAVRSQSLPGYVNLGVRTLVVHSSIQIGRFFELFFDIFCTSPGCRVFFTVRNFQYVWRWYHDIISRAKGDCYYNHCFSAAVCQGWHVRERRQGSGGKTVHKLKLFQTSPTAAWIGATVWWSQILPPLLIARL